MRSSKSMIAGAASHIAFTGGWLARKSPPNMVSSRCCQVVSPSPLRFLAALIPPCAQTECERLTGTMENKSTCPPASAILITAARPARPPPTTMILGAAMKTFHHRGHEGSRRRTGLMAPLALVFLRVLCGSLLVRALHGLLCRQIGRSILPLRAEERGQRRHPNRDQRDGENGAHHAHRLARPLAYSDSPLGAEQVQTITKMPRCGGDADHVKRDRPGALQFQLYLAERSL